MGVKDAVKALLERLPDDCNLDDVVDLLYELQQMEAGRSNAPPLAPVHRVELDRRLDLLMQGQGRTLPWVHVRRELEREE